MTQLNDSSFYVTLTSSKTPEFPDNTPTRFQYRLPQPLWLPGKWKVGVSNVFLPGTQNPIPHVVTSHVSSPKQQQPHETVPTKPVPIRSLLHLYRGSSNDILFQQYAKAWNNSLSKDILSKLKKADLQDASNGFEFMGKVFRWMEQDLNKQLPTHYSYAGAGDVWRMTVKAEDASWIVRFSDIDPSNQKLFPYFAINLFLAQQMGWIQETASNVYDIGNNLIMELDNNQDSVKADPATCLNKQFTFTKPIHVSNGLVYLSSTVNWRFVNLKEAFEKAIHRPYETPKTALNVFQPWMNNLKLWTPSLGLELDDLFVELPVSPHYWKKRVLSVSLLEGVKLVEGVSHGEYNGEMEIDMSSLTQNVVYTVAIEWYQRDLWLFNRSRFSAEGTGLQVDHLRTEKHTHEQHKTHLIYYHTLTIQFTKTDKDSATLSVKFEIGYPLPKTYPSTLKDNTFLVLYGVQGKIEHVPDVYDDHPVIHSSHTTTETKTTSDTSKKASTLPTSHGLHNVRPLLLSCNLTKSVYVNNTIMKTLPYENKAALIECNPIQFYSLRSYLVDIVEVTLKEWNSDPPDLHQDKPVMVTLYFKKKLEPSQRKYIRLEESVERDPSI